MSDRSVTLTARKVPCPTCHAPRFEFCRHADGTETERSHPERVAAAKLESDLTPAMDAALRKLHVDPTRELHPTVRDCLLRRGLIEAMDPPVGPRTERLARDRLARRPRRRFPLTDAGRAAIGVADAAPAATSAMPPKPIGINFVYRPRPNPQRCCPVCGEPGHDSRRHRGRFVEP